MFTTMAYVIDFMFAFYLYIKNAFCSLFSGLTKTFIQQELERAGITVNGDNAWDIKVNDERMYAKWASHGTLGVGESYMVSHI